MSFVIAADWRRLMLRPQQTSLLKRGEIPVFPGVFVGGERHQCSIGRRIGKHGGAQAFGRGSLLSNELVPRQCRGCSDDIEDKRNKWGSEIVRNCRLRIKDSGKARKEGVERL